MASLVVQESVRDIPRLSLSVDHHSSTSPFPSPGSPFLPPPKLNAHEFAARPPLTDQIMRPIETRRKSKDEADGLTTTIDGEATPTITLPASPPITPTPQAFRPQSKVTIPSPPEQQAPVDKQLHRESLTSSRPAPPSPAASRRTSAALSRHSSYARSRPQSRVTSLSQSQVPIIQHDQESSSSTAVPPKRRSLLMKIRDFAYKPDDKRHQGKGPDMPRPNRPRHRDSVYSTSSSSAAEDEEDVEASEEDQRHNSWSSFRWNTLSQHFWGTKRGEIEEPEDAGPSRTDFARNFDASSPTDEQLEPEYGDGDGDSDDDFLQSGDDEPLVPGTYRAVYAFEPEGTAEMALEEEQIVHVIGKGGGVGWAIVEKEDGGHALVPESYLELVKADEPDPLA